MRFDNEVLRLYHRIEELLTLPVPGSRALNPAYRELSGILTEVQNSIANFSNPLRVAVAGYMKAGKSTLLNAILRRRTLCTGDLICTYTPVWFRYAPEESMSLFFKDQSSLTGLPLSELETWTSIQNRASNRRMDDVEYVVIYSPNEILRQLELIDTPGLFSPEEEDSRRTIHLLGLNGLDDANKRNEQQVSMADAVLYAFAANFRENDLRAIDSFTSTSINAIGVFTKLDQSYWNALDDPQIPPAQRMAPVLTRYNGELKNRLYRILPVVGIVVEGFAELEPELWSALCSIAREEPDRVTMALRSTKRFLSSGIGGIAEGALRRLVERFGTYGIYCVVHGIQSGVSKEDMEEYLYKQSGVKDVVDLLLSHFGTRSRLIKTEAALGRIESKLHKLAYSDSVTRQARQMCDQIEREISTIRDLRNFSELRLLRQFYEGTLLFPSEELNRSFLQLMGEYGNSAAAKLGMPEDASIPVLVQKAKEQHELWSALRMDFTLSRSTKAAMKTVLDGIGELRYHLGMLTAF